MALRNAYAIDMLAPDTLTRRRERIAGIHGLSTDTIELYWPRPSSLGGSAARPRSYGFTRTDQGQRHRCLPGQRTGHIP